MITIDGVRMSELAAQVVEDAGIDVAEDLRSMRESEQSEAEFLESCLDGADEPDVRRGWREYVAAIMLVVETERG